MDKVNKTKKILSGNIAKIVDEKTLKVRVESKYPHPKYQKIVKSHKTYLADFDGDISKVNVGAGVVIEECKPVSKRKTWRVTNIIE